MKSKNLLLAVISVIILVFNVSIGFILDAYSLRIVAKDCYVLYICAKCVSVAAFIAIVLAGFLKKDIAHYIIQYIATLSVQFVPLIIRYLSISSRGFLISVIISFIALVIYCAIVLGLSVLSKKTIQTAKALEGKRIPVKEEKEDA